VRPRSRTRLTEKETRDLRVRQSNLNALTEHHSWAALVEAVDRRVAETERAVLRQVLHSKQGLSLEDQAYLKGFVEGIRAFTRTPTQAEARLDRFLQAHGITATEESDAA